MSVTSVDLSKEEASCVEKIVSTNMGVSTSWEIIAQQVLVALAAKDIRDDSESLSRVLEAVAPRLTREPPDASIVQEQFAQRGQLYSVMQFAGTTLNVPSNDHLPSNDEVQVDGAIRPAPGAYVLYPVIHTNGFHPLLPTPTSLVSRAAVQRILTKIRGGIPQGLAKSVAPSPDVIARTVIQMSEGGPELCQAVALNYGLTECDWVEVFECEQRRIAREKPVAVTTSFPEKPKENGAPVVVQPPKKREWETIGLVPGPRDFAKRNAGDRNLAGGRGTRNILDEL